MSYSTALHVFALVLALLCVGLMAVISHYTVSASPVPSVLHVSRSEEPTLQGLHGLRAAAARWPELLMRGGVVCLLASFVVLVVTCCRIASL
jgi:hypothetical protein